MAADGARAAAPPIGTVSLQWDSRTPSTNRFASRRPSLERGGPIVARCGGGLLLPRGHRRPTGAGAHRRRVDCRAGHRDHRTERFGKVDSGAAPGWAQSSDRRADRGQPETVRPTRRPASTPVAGPRSGPSNRHGLPESRAPVPHWPSARRAFPRPAAGRRGRPGGARPGRGATATVGPARLRGCQSVHPFRGSAAPALGGHLAGHPAQRPGPGRADLRPGSGHLGGVDRPAR